MFAEVILSEFLIESHVELLKEIIEVLCDGDVPEAMMAQFEQECDGISQEELLTLFKQLDTQQVDFRNCDRVIDYFENVVQEKMALAKLRPYPAGHPVRVYLEENILLRSWIKAISQFDPTQQLEEFAEVFKSICKVELHYQRKENQLFPCLEKHGWDSPSKNMWAFHDENRAILKEIRLAIEQGDAVLVSQKAPYLFSELDRMMQIEEQRLLPNAMELLDEEDWLDMRTGDREIGWMLGSEPAPFPVISDGDVPEEEPELEASQTVEQYEHPSQAKRKKKLPFDTTGMFHFDEGYMTPEQVNLIFKTLPLDITYVDENDKVLFYNRGQERLFPRSAGIIGREVHLCHPPKSVDTVLRIVEEFKKGTRDVADFRINIRGRFVVIRYFAVRDDEKNYRGVLEMSQDITDIQTLEGEQRLLDWA